MLAWATAGLHLMFPEMGKSWKESKEGAGFGKSQRGGDPFKRDMLFRPESKMMRAQWI